MPNSCIDPSKHYKHSKGKKIHIGKQEFPLRRKGVGKHRSAPPLPPVLQQIPFPTLLMEF